MKIIISRKGFDSTASNGGRPSPLFSDGGMFSLPIPERTEHNPFAPPYRELHAGSHNLGRLVEDLTGGKINSDSHAHLDPDLNAESRPNRPAGWRPIFGQAAAAESHLRHQGVSAGDLFLFFGWFRDVVKENSRYRYAPHSRGRHVLFGWLQIEQRVTLGEGQPPPDWAREHPHLLPGGYNQDNNSIYLAAPELTIDGKEMNRPGAGLFTCYSPKFCLTAPGYTRSIWQLPAGFYPQAGRKPLSYHGRPGRWSWTPDNEHVLLQTVGIGQEFVLDCDDYPEAKNWLFTLLQQ